MGYFIDCITKKYACFSGRARRAEYWHYVLYGTFFNFLITAAACMIAYGIEASNYSSPETVWNSVNMARGVTSLLLALFFFLPGFGVFVRRMHDIGKSGWNYLWALVPLIGTVVLLVFMVTDSQRGDNQYGPDPKASTIR